MIDGENIISQSIKIYINANENIRKITIDQVNDYITGCLITYHYLKKIIR